MAKIEIQQITKRYENRREFFGNLAAFIVFNIVVWGVLIPQEGWRTIATLITGGWSLGLVVQFINFIMTEARENAIAKAIEFNSDEVLQVEQGSLYPALHRLIKRGWISAEEGTSENNRRAKFYRLTVKGRRQLVIATSKWDKLAGAIARILRPAEQEGES